MAMRIEVEQFISHSNTEKSSSFILEIEPREKEEKKSV
jgi:hypothetical protein